MRRLSLKFAIIASGKTQRDLSIETGVPEVRLSLIVCGRRDPTSEEMATIARALKTSPAALFEDESQVA